jgi:glycosyltransferase involved in cell wall biosynthesis
MESLAQRLGVAGSTTFLGRVNHSEVPTIIDQHKYLVLPSLRESSGSQILEAASRGVPAIFFDFIGASTWFSDDSSLIVPTRNSLDIDSLSFLLSNTLSESITLPNEVYSLKCNKSLEIAKSNTWNQKAKALHKIYEAVLNRNEA